MIWQQQGVVKLCDILLLRIFLYVIFYHISQSFQVSKYEPGDADLSGRCEKLELGEFWAAGVGPPL